MDRYAKAINAKTGHGVNVSNDSEHSGLQVDDLLTELSNASEKNTLAHADIIVVGIAHNDVPMNRDDDPCDGAGGDNPDWSKYTAACVKADVAIFQPKYESVFKQIAALRAGKPTILRALNRYNDWNDGATLSPAGVAATKLVIDAWSKMTCGAAKANGFLCANIYRVQWPRRTEAVRQPSRCRLHPPARQGQRGDCSDPHRPRTCTVGYPVEPLVTL